MVRLAGALAVRASLRVGSVRTLLVAVLAALAYPQPASAHLVTSGAGPFFDGVAHFFVSASDLLAVVVLALFAGLAGKDVARRVALLLPVAWLAGTLAGYGTQGAALDVSWFGAGSLLVCGLLLVINPKLPILVMGALAIAVGGFHGMFNGAAISATSSSILTAMGIVTAAGVVGLLLSAAAVSVTAKWQQIALRVIGSWVAAVGLLSIAWEIRSRMH